MIFILYMRKEFGLVLTNETGLKSKMGERQVVVSDGFFIIERMDYNLFLIMCFCKCKGLFITMKTVSEMPVKYSSGITDIAEEFMCF